MFGRDNCTVLDNNKEEKKKLIFFFIYVFQVYKKQYLHESMNAEQW